MKVDQFDFKLPDKNIALRPAEPRDSSRLLVVKRGGELEDKNFTDLLEYLKPGDALVFNDTRVIPAQFEGTRERNGNVARVGITLHRRLSANRWAAFAKGAKKLRVGDCISFGVKDKTCLADALDATVAQMGEGGEIELDFDFSGPVLDEAMMGVGHMPLPPYIASKRPVDKRDVIDYQTLYARNDGAVAAPTAGLHFSDEIFSRLEQKGISRHFVTLHVGAGTFLPVKVDDSDDHKMHYENGVISAEVAQALNKVRGEGGRLISVGTTSLRLLESAVDEAGNIEQWSGATDIFITPGYRFRAVDMLITNFHLPRSTLFMLVSAFSGLEVMHNAYSHAIGENYRFYSYGDASLLYCDR